jgi:hypothetical protein
MVSNGWLSILRTPRVCRNYANHQCAESFFAGRGPHFFGRQPETHWQLAIFLLAPFNHYEHLLAIWVVASQSPTAQEGWLYLAGLKDLYSLSTKSIQHQRSIRVQRRVVLLPVGRPVRWPCRGICAVRYPRPSLATAEPNWCSQAALKWNHGTAPTSRNDEAGRPQVRTHSFTAQPPDLRHVALTTRASRLRARSPCSAAPSIRFLFIGSQFRSTLPPHGRLLFRSCASLRSLWSACGGTFTHKSAPLPGAHEKTAGAKAGRVARVRVDQPLLRRPAEMPLIDMCNPLRVASSSTPAR